MPTPCSHSDRTKHTRAVLMEFRCMPHAPQLSSNTPTKHCGQFPGVFFFFVSLCALCAKVCMVLHCVRFHFTSVLAYILRWRLLSAAYIIRPMRTNTNTHGILWRYECVFMHVHGSVLLWARVVLLHLAQWILVCATHWKSALCHIHKRIHIWCTRTYCAYILSQLAWMCLSPCIWLF